MGNTDPEGRAFTTSAPPSYDSIFGQLQAQKSQSDGVVDYAKNATGMCCGKVAGAAALAIGVIIFLALGLALPIAEITIGSMYLHDCPAEKYLTIYLIVMGVFSIVSGCTGGGSKAANRNESEEEEGSSKKTAGSCCNSLVGMFLTAWFICGNVWVFTMKECAGSMVPGHDSCFTRDVSLKGNATYGKYYCESIVYDFVYWETIAKWAILGFFLVIGCLCCCVVCCAYCCSSNSDDEAS